METILFLNAQPGDKLVSQNLMSVFIEKKLGWMNVEKPSMVLNDEVVQCFKATIHHATDAQVLVRELAKRFGYVACIGYGNCYYAAVPTQDELGWEVELVESMSEKAGYAGIGSQHFRSISFN